MERMPHPIEMSKLQYLKFLDKLLNRISQNNTFFSSVDAMRV